MALSATVPQEIIEKIRKCLALTRSNFEAEAKLALAKAQELMTQYGLSMKDVDIAPDGHLKKDKITQNYSKPFWMAPWEKKLAKVPGNLLPVYLIFTPTPDNHLRLQFVGTAQDSALAIEIYSILRKELLRISREEPDGVSRRSFLFGCAQVLDSRSYEIKSAREKSATGPIAGVDPGKALVVVKGQDIVKYVEEKFKGSLKSMHSRGPSDFDEIAYHRGKAAGAAINLNFQEGLTHGGAK